MNELTNDILTRTYHGNTLMAWLIALGIILAVWMGLLLLRKLAVKAVKRLVQKTTFAWDDVLAAVIPKTHGLFLLTLAIMAGTRPLDLSLRAESWLRTGILLVASIQVGWWSSSAVQFFVGKHREQRLKQDPASVTTINALGWLATFVVWILVFLLVLTNLGLHIGPLLAGLGVGGIAVALAVQTVLKDLLASLSIMFDKPFVVGDFVIVGDLLGAVEHIGIKTTRIRSLSGEQLVFSNNDLIESRLRNFGRMRERRVSFNLGVTYQTSREKLAKVPGIIKAAIESQEMTRFDRSHFNKYGDFALNFESVFYVATPDYNKWMDIQQAINLRINEGFEKEGIEFAYPTQTIFTIRQGGETSKSNSVESSVR